MFQTKQIQYIKIFWILNLSLVVLWMLYKSGMVD